MTGKLLKWLQWDGGEGGQATSTRVLIHNECPCFTPGASHDLRTQRRLPVLQGVLGPEQLCVLPWVSWEEGI